MPTKSKQAEIVDYWTGRQDECGFGVDWAEAHERCWRCGYRSVLQRCHIVPEATGGENDPSNLVLLCGRCHREAPNVADPRFMWIWLRATCVAFYDSYWTARGIEEFESMFGRRPFEGEGFRKIDLNVAHEAFQKHLEKTTIHFSEGRMNPSTIASVFALVEEDLVGRLPEPVGTSSVGARLLRAVGFIQDTKDASAAEQVVAAAGASPRR